MRVATLTLLLTLSACGGGSTKPAAGNLSVDAGPDGSIAFHEAASLTGTVSGGGASVRWSRVSGPGSVFFEDDRATTTRAAFTAGGNYTLSLFASSGADTGADQVRVTVSAPSGPVLVVDPTTNYQTMTGWEATTYAGQDSLAFDNFKDAVFDAAVNDLGIDRVRLEVRSGAENQEDYWAQQLAGTIDYATWRSRRYSTINDNADPNVIDPAGFQWSELDDQIDRIVLPLKTRVEARGETLWINLCYVAFTSQIGGGLLYHHDDPDEYAEFVEATWLHLQAKYGWVPDTWEVILEPDNVSQWNGTLIGQAIVAAAARLQARGFSPRFVAPSNTNMANAITYFDALAAVPGAVSHLKEFSYHRYGGVSDSNLQAIQSRAMTWGIDTAHLEWIGASYHELHRDLAIAGNSAWSEFVLAGLGPDNGGAYYVVDDSSPSSPVVSLGSRARFLRQYFKFVRRGAVRLGASPSPGLDPLAFENADGRMVVVVKADAGDGFYIRGLDAGTYGIKYTTSAQYDMDLADAQTIDGQSLRASIPAAGVLTVYRR
ncbi:MAG: glycoside hydrolase [Planctomycetota bacterium]|jgi:hypothetical protein